MAQRAKEILHRTWRDSTVPLRRERIRSASRKVVTPFSGFILSSYYLSSEIEASGLSYLNPHSQNLAAGAMPTTDGQVLFVQVDQLNEFVLSVLPSIRKQFVLITGKWHLPGLSSSKTVEDLAKSSKVITWFSQNQVFPNLPIEPFPFGVELTTAPHVQRLMKSKQQEKSIEVLVPRARVHPHFPADIRRMRETLAPHMEREMPVKDYLKQIAKSKFVVSPPGDRPDTYRHWESIALEAVPVGIVQYPLRGLFGQSMFSVQDFEGITSQEFPSHARPDRSLVLLETWKRRVQN